MRFREILLRIAPLLVTLGFVSCGGGSGSSGQAAKVVPVPASTSHGLGNITFSFKIPGKTGSSHARKPQWISPSTSAFLIAVTNASGYSQSSFVSVTCTAPCTQAAAVAAPVNATDTFSVKAIDNAGNTLSDATITQFVPPGITTIPMTLGGSVDSVTLLNICPVSNPSCSSTTQVVPSGSAAQFSVAAFTARDVDGNIIMGPYDAPISLQIVEGDNSNALSLSKSTLSGSSDQAVLTYNGAFDGQNAVSGAISCSSCGSLGSPSGYSTLLASCPAATTSAPVCTSFGMFAGGAGAQSGTAAGLNQGSLVAVAGKIWFSEIDFLATIDGNGLVTEYPPGLTEASKFPGPPASVTSSGVGGPVFIGPLAGAGSVVYFTEDLPVNGLGLLLGSLNASAPINGWAEYPASQNAGWTSVDQLATGSDGNLYGVTGQASILGQFNLTTFAAANYCLGSLNAPAGLVTTLGANAYYIASYSNLQGNTAETIGFFPFNQPPATCIPAANETNLPGPASNPLVVDGLAPDPVAGNLIWFTAQRTDGTAGEIGTYNTATKVIKQYPLPAATWNGLNSPVFLGFIAYNPADHFMYFDDALNGIIGRIPEATPSAGAIQGYGTKFSEGFNNNEVDGNLNAPFLPDSGVFGTDGNLYFDESGQINGATMTGTGVGILHPSLVPWTASPIKGMSVGRRPQSVRLNQRRGRLSRPARKS
ncbi:MAG: hypothetical protein NVSMB31_05410 [Vulcanimicrobiaceae bacterium]